MPTSSEPSKFRTAKLWLIRPFSVTIVRKERLLREILVMENEINTFNWEKKEAGKKEALDELDEAREASEKCNFEKGWGKLANTERIIIKYMDDAQRQIKAQLLLIESEKIKSTWRQKQMKLLLGKLCDERLHAVGTDELLRAAWVRNDYYMTSSHKMNLHKVNANILTLVTSLILGGIIFISYYWDIAAPDAFADQNFHKRLVVSAIFGALGAGFSYGKTLFSYNPELNKIPDQLLSMAVTFFRFVIGASSAIMILLFLKSGFLNEQVSKGIINSSSTFVVLSFAAGFSERFIVKMVGLIVKEDEKK